MTVLLAHHDVLHLLGAASVLGSTGVSAGILLHIARLQRRKNARSSRNLTTTTATNTLRFEETDYVYED